MPSWPGIRHVQGPVRSTSAHGGHCTSRHSSMSATPFGLLGPPFSSSLTRCEMLRQPRGDRYRLRPYHMPACLTGRSRPVRVVTTHHCICNARTLGEPVYSRLTSRLLSRRMSRRRKLRMPCTGRAPVAHYWPIVPSCRCHLRNILQSFRCEAKRREEGSEQEQV